MPSKKKKSSAAIARAAFDSSPRPVESEAPPQQRERPVTEEARPPPRLLTAREVMERVGLTYVSIWKKMKTGQFPAPLELSPKTLRWVEADIDRWVENLPRRQFKGAAR